MRKWSRGLSDWPLTERRGDTYGGQPSVAVDLHGHTAIKNSRSGAGLAIWRGLVPAVSPAKSCRHLFIAPTVQHGAFPTNTVRPQLQDAVQARLARPALPVPGAWTKVHVVL